MQKREGGVEVQTVCAGVFFLLESRRRRDGEAPDMYAVAVRRSVSLSLGDRRPETLGCDGSMRITQGQAGPRGTKERHRWHATNRQNRWIKPPALPKGCPALVRCLAASMQRGSPSDTA